MGRGDRCIHTTVQLGENSSSPNHLDTADRGLTVIFAVASKDTPNATLDLVFPEFDWSLKLADGDVGVFNAFWYEHMSCISKGTLHTLTMYNKAIL